MDLEKSSIPDGGCMDSPTDERRELIQLADKLERGGRHALDNAETSRAVGDFWRSRRKEQHLSRDLVAGKVDVLPAHLAAFERGDVSYKDLSSDFLPRLAIAISNIALLDRFILEIGPRAFDFRAIREHTL
jgi:hypothetical protein